MGALEIEAQRLLRASLATSTHSVYQRGISALQQFRCQWGFPDLWPVPEGQIVAFISSMSLAGKSPATIGSYIAGIAFQHKIRGWQDPTKTFVAQKLLEGCKRLNGRADTRLPVTLTILQDMLSALGRACRSNYEVALFEAAFTLAFFAFLRVGEFTTKSRNDKGERVLAVHDIAFKDPGHSAVQVRVRFSKTDQHGRAVVLVICKAPGVPICPVAAIERYLAIRPVCVGPFFIHMDKSPLTRFQFQSILTKSLLFSGHSVGKYSTHSFRIGAATTAAVCGFTPDEIKCFGRWRSGAFKRYIRPQDFCFPPCEV